MQEELLGNKDTSARIIKRIGRMDKQGPSNALKQLMGNNPGKQTGLDKLSLKGLDRQDESQMKKIKYRKAGFNKKSKEILSMIEKPLKNSKLVYQNRFKSKEPNNKELLSEKKDVTMSFSELIKYKQKKSQSEDKGRKQYSLSKSKLKGEDSNRRSNTQNINEIFNKDRKQLNKLQFKHRKSKGKLVLSNISNIYSSKQTQKDKPGLNSSMMPSIRNRNLYAPNQNHLTKIQSPDLFNKARHKSDNIRTISTSKHKIKYIDRLLNVLNKNHKMNTYIGSSRFSRQFFIEKLSK